MILEEFDEERIAIINPEVQIEKIEGFPKIGVTCFSKKLLESIVDKFESRIIAYMNNANGKIPIYVIRYKEIEVALFYSRVGSPACVGGIEEVIAMGMEKCIMFGTCGVLESDIEELSIIIPNSAIRDEGTSYHYMKATDEISVNEKYMDKFINLLNEHKYTYTIGTTWTTDAFYRETPNKVKRRKEQGAICVDMECSAVSVLAKYRNIEFFEFFYAADNLASSVWDKRNLSCSKDLSEKGKIGLLALELAIKIV